MQGRGTRGKAVLAVTATFAGTCTFASAKPEHVASTSQSRREERGIARFWGVASPAGTRMGPCEVQEG